MPEDLAPSLFFPSRIDASVNKREHERIRKTLDALREVCPGCPVSGAPSSSSGRT